MSIEPVLVMLMCQLKYGPWRRALAQHWEKIVEGRTGVPVYRPDVPTRAARLVTVLRATAAAVNRTKVDRAWMQNVGRFVGRNQGLSHQL
jgi:hypothetical protein